jgi:hypothetical protein
VRLELELKLCKQPQAIVESHEISQIVACN